VRGGREGGSLAEETSRQRQRRLYRGGAGSLHDVSATRLVAVVRRAPDGVVGARRASHSRCPSVVVVTLATERMSSPGSGGPQLGKKKGRRRLAWAGKRACGMGQILCTYTFCVHNVYI
jgi:hypothetical protein